MPALPGFPKELPSKFIFIHPTGGVIHFGVTFGFIFLSQITALQLRKISLVPTKKLGPVLKTLVLLFLPVPLILWPILGIVGSILLAIGYGFFAPLIATFEAVGEQVVDKLFHCFIDGCWSTLEGSCTIVRDVTDFCFHSYFSYMDELCEKVAEDEKPADIKIKMLPSCLLASLLAVPIDVLIITILALWKSPYMLFKGWQRLFEDLIGREGPFLETVCVPFAGLAIILWPIAVVGAVVAAFICSFFLGLYAGVIVHQENSLQMGFAYIISIISMFDEYTNDLLYLREGSCLPRPKYHKKGSPPGLLERKQSINNSKYEQKNGKGGPYGTKLVTERSKTLKKAIQQLKPIQIWDWLFQSCELHGRILFRDGLISVADIGECILKGRCKKLSIKLPAYCILQCLLRSARSNSPGLLITEEIELTMFNWPNDKVLEWFLGPLLIMKEQIRGLQLDENEEACVSKLIMGYNNENPEDWNDSGFPADDNVRRAQLQAIFRRLQGIVTSMSLIPTFRRRFRNLVKVLYVEAIATGALSSDQESNKSKGDTSRSNNHGDKQDEEVAENKVGTRPFDNGDIDIV
ncbi:putative membrane protein At3g27390 isoform X2 [Tasmannia lanceolata]|uniref:putative membrane protein At3g27390 isoform X2 n=1 Tax=Tasmannia lanceolata TaxID=3420 RepID=UPI00406498D6